MTERIDHTHHDHDNTARARKACRMMLSNVLNDARSMYIEGEGTDAYNEQVCTVALTWNITVHAAYILIEEGQL